MLITADAKKLFWRCRRIAFEDPDSEEAEQRAWDGLIPNRILIYCL